MKKIYKYFVGIAAAMTAAASAAAAASAFSETSLWLPGVNNNAWGGSGSSMVGDADFNVWANGKDTKDNKKTPENEERLYKTGKIQHIAMSTGGKWNVAITDISVTSVGDFLTRLDSKGKFVDAKSAENKLIASAKIKDGEITVTAGKQAGRVNVWVYETNKDGVVYMPNYNVRPTMYTVNVKLSGGSPVLAELEDVEAGVLKSGAKPVTKLEMGFESGRNAVQETKRLMLADKKEASDPDSTYTISYKNSDKTETPSVVLANLNADGTTVTLTPISEGKTTINITNDQSGKAAKLTVEVKGMFEVGFDNKLVKVEDVSDKKEPVEVRNGDNVIDGTPLKITKLENVEVDQISANGKSVKSGGTYKVSGENVQILAGKAYSVVVTGSDKTNTVVNVGDSKNVKKATLPEGSRLKLTLAAGKTASVTSGTGNPVTYTGPASVEVIVNADTVIAITKQA